MTKTIKFGKGIFLVEKGILKSKLARRIAFFRPWMRNHLLVLEREATTEVTNSIHGRCRHELLLNSDLFLDIVKELNSERFEKLSEIKCLALKRLEKN